MRKILQCLKLKSCVRFIEIFNNSVVMYNDDPDIKTITFNKFEQIGKY